VLAANEGRSIPKGWAVDSSGSDTTDPKEALEGALLPMAGHKGYGLALSVEILSSVLTGAGFSFDIKQIPYTQGGLYVEASDIGLFRELEEYYEDMSKLLDRIKTSSLAKEFKAIYLPGELEFEEKSRRARSGIPISRSLWKDLERLASKLSIEMPRLTPAEA